MTILVFTAQMDDAQHRALLFWCVGIAEVGETCKFTLFFAVLLRFVDYKDERDAF